MPSSEKTAQLRAAMAMEPKDAVAYFRSKGYQITDQWQEMEGRAHARAFTVAKAASMDVLEVIRNGLDKALAEGTTEETFVKEVTPRLQKAGWWGKETRTDAQGNDYEVQLGSPWRLKNIYRTNLSTAYNVGRYRRQLAAVEFRPYWQYLAVMDTETRPLHRLLHGKVFRWDDPVWAVIYPPNGWGCRCRVRNLTDRNLEREGLTVENGADWIETVEREAGIDYQTGEVITVQHSQVRLPDGSVMIPDIGWDHNPGSAAFGVDAAIARSIGRVTHTGLRSQVINSLNNSEARQAVFEQWMGSALYKLETRRNIGEQLAQNPSRERQRELQQSLAQTGLSQKNWQPVMFMPEELGAAYFEKTGLMPSRLIVVSESQVEHLDSDRHIREGAAVSREVYLALPRLMADAESVYRDKRNGRLLYVLERNADEVAVAVVGPEERMEKSQSSVVDKLISAYWTTSARLTNAGIYERVYPRD